MVDAVHPSFTKTGKLEPFVRDIINSLNEDVSDTTGVQEPGVEFNKLESVPPDELDGYFTMVYRGSGVIGINADVLSSLVDRNNDPSLDEGDINNLRHEWAHAIDNDINNESYKLLEPDDPWDIINSPKEAYAIFEGSRIDDNFGSSHLDNPWSIPGYWQKTATIEEDEVKIDGSPHKLGAYSAKKIDEASKEKYPENEGKQEDFARKKLLSATTLGDLMDYTREAHKILDEPFYHDILQEQFENVQKAEKRHVDNAIGSAANAYSEDAEINLEQFYEHAALVESYKEVYDEENERLNQLNQAIRSLTSEKSEGGYQTI